MLAAWSNEDIMHNIFISETCAMDEPPLKMQKLEQNGKILYLVWPPDGQPPNLLNCQMKAQEFLEKENLLSVVPLSRFDFKKPNSEDSSPSLSLSSSSPPKSHTSTHSQGSTGSKASTSRKSKAMPAPQAPTMSDVFADPDDVDDDNGLQARNFNLPNLLAPKGSLDHEKTLKDTASMLETLRFETNSPEIDASKFERLQQDLSAAGDVKSLVSILGTCDKAAQEMIKLSERKCFEELMTLSSVEGPLPLADWPIDMSKNWYSEVVHFAAQHSPTTLSLLLKLIVSDPSSSIRPEHILTPASIYAQIGKEVDRKNNALDIIQALSLKMDGLSDQGLDGQAKIGLSSQARTLRYKRDQLAEVQTPMIVEESRKLPSQVTLDNCNTQKIDCIVAYSQTETLDTSHLPVEGLNMEDTLSLFHPKIFTLKEHKQEFDHLQYVVMLAIGRELAALLPDQVGHWQQVLPEHHAHKQSDLPLVKAQITVLPPMHYKETLPKDMIAMAMELQLEKLKLLRQVYPGNAQYAQDLDRIQVEITGEETPQERVEREAAEHRVKLVVLQHGELIGHGDLMTFQKVRQAVMAQADEVRALDRLDFIGIFRLQIFHLVMSKVCTDIKAAMPNMTMVEDKGSLANAAALLGILEWFSNKKQVIVRDDHYERHAQTLKAFQLALLTNMFQNYVKKAGVDLNAVRTGQEVIDCLTKMMLSFGALWYWDVDAVDPLEDRGCSLLRSSRDQVVRLALDLAFRQAQHENDAVALRALRRVMIVYFSASTSKSKYALYTLHDMVVEESSSARSRARMDMLATVNPSGRKGGFLYRDMYNEVGIDIYLKFSALGHNCRFSYGS